MIQYALLVKTNCVSIRYTLTIHLDADNVSNLQKNQNDVDLDICTGCDWFNDICYLSRIYRLVFSLCVRRCHFISLTIFVFWSSIDDQCRTDRIQPTIYPHMWNDC